MRIRSSVAVQAAPRPRHSARAPARAAITIKSTPLRCASFASRAQTESRKAIAGMSTSRQMRERSRDVDRASDCERLAGGNDQNSLETGSRFGERRRIERAVIEDRDQAPARHPRHKPRREAPAPGRPFERRDDSAREDRRRGADRAPGWRSERALRPERRKRLALRRALRASKALRLASSRSSLDTAQELGANAAMGDSS